MTQGTAERYAREDQQRANSLARRIAIIERERVACEVVGKTERAATLARKILDEKFLAARREAAVDSSRQQVRIVAQRRQIEQRRRATQSKI